jgi:phosphatidylserine decarboxylase
MQLLCRYAIVPATEMPSFFLVPIARRVTSRVDRNLRPFYGRWMVPLTRHGWREMLIGSLVLVATAVGLGYISLPLSLIVLPVLIWLFAFFRDPERTVPAEQHSMVSPADGKVSDIIEVAHDELLGGPAVRIGIFLSVFNVHVNRSPCDGRVLTVNYKKGKFINAMRHGEASDETESNTVVLAEPKGDKPIAVVKQIVGLIARRIICTVSTGDTVERGQRIGMIKFGSRTELSIPKWMEPQIKVQVGQTVRGAMDVIAVLGKPIHTETRAADGEEFEPLVPRETPA